MRRQAFAQARTSSSSSSGSGQGLVASLSLWLMMVCMREPQQSGRAAAAGSEEESAAGGARAAGGAQSRDPRPDIQHAAGTVRSRARGCSARQQDPGQQARWRSTASAGGWQTRRVPQRRSGGPARGSRGPGPVRTQGLASLTGAGQAAAGAQGAQAGRARAVPGAKKRRSKGTPRSNRGPEAGRTPSRPKAGAPGPRRAGFRRHLPPCSRAAKGWFRGV